MGTLTVTVVVATYQRPDGIARLLGGLAAQDVTDFDVIVVDDGSEPPAAPPDLAPLAGRVRLIRQPNGGPGKARDTGIRQATGEVIVVVDDDMVVQPGFVSAHRARHQAGTDVAIGRYRVIGEGTELLRFQMQTIDDYFDRCERDESQIEPARLSTGNVSFRRALYERVGGFDLQLRRCEDKELGLKFEAAGAVFGFAAGADAEHHDRPLVRKRWLRVGYEYGQADVAISRLHPTLRNASPWHLLVSMPRPVQRLFETTIRHRWLVAPLEATSGLTGEVLRRVGLRRIGAKVSGLSFALRYFDGVRSAYPSAAEALAALGAFRL